MIYIYCVLTQIIKIRVHFKKKTHINASSKSSNLKIIFLIKKQLFPEP